MIEVNHVVQSSSASAPGKAILFGEHAVVYNAVAVAGSLSDLRIHVTTVSKLILYGFMLMITT